MVSIAQKLIAWWRPKPLGTTEALSDVPVRERWRWGMGVREKQEAGATDEG